LFYDRESGERSIMDSVEQSLSRLEQLAQELECQGESALAARIGSEVTVLRAETAPPKLMTTGEAAEALGIRSVNTIKRWAQDGKLEGFRRGGRVLVSARSVAELAESSAIGHERAYERELDEALAPFDAGDGEIPELGLTWSGRKPWKPDVPTRS
jgi:excisionase family DNA binding protein